jgi:hypothetical protein
MPGTNGDLNLEWREDHGQTPRMAMTPCIHSILQTWSVAVPAPTGGAHLLRNPEDI